MMRGNEHARRGNGGASPSNAPVITQDKCCWHPSSLALLLTVYKETKFWILFSRSHSPLRYIIISWELILISSVEKIMTSRIFHF